MRKIAANYIFPVSCKPIKNGVVVCDDNGVIIDVIDNQGVLNETANLEHYNGIIIPGFVNVHCHLELSYLKKKIAEKTGIQGFIAAVRENRKNVTNDILLAIKLADEELLQNGVVAVGDISNSDISFEVKSKSSLYYHTFVEVFGYQEKDEESIFNNALQLYNSAKKHSLETSIVPHAPYSLSTKLFSKVLDNAKKQKSILSIHNQESAEENELFINRSGKLFDQLMLINNEYSNWKPSGKSSLQSYLCDFQNESNILLVHNTFTNKNDIKYARLKKNLYWVFCPNSNKFIEDELPNISLFKEFSNFLSIGTDSLASNKTLSVLDELKTISVAFPEIDLDDLLKWATINGARALNIDKQYGSIEKGKSPGLLLLNNINFDTPQITKETSVRRLL